MNEKTTSRYFIFKRLGDIVLSTAGLIACIPAFLAIAAIIKAYDGGPVFFSQTRVGFEGENFKMLKFRTMRTDAEAMLPQLLEEQDNYDRTGNEVMLKLRKDPRITGPGKFLRQYSLDELPQLINVLRGQMTLIGPRPPLPREVSTFSTEALGKFDVKPGLTGLWQTMGRSNLPWEKAIRLDLYYAENVNPQLDLQILMRTFRAVLSKEGAY